MTLTSELVISVITDRLHELEDINDNALDMIMDPHIDKELFTIYEERYNISFECMTELRRVLRRINTLV